MNSQTTKENDKKPLGSEVDYDNGEEEEEETDDEEYEDDDENEEDDEENEDLVDAEELNNKNKLSELKKVDKLASPVRISQQQNRSESGGTQASQNDDEDLDDEEEEEEEEDGDEQHEKLPFDLDKKRISLSSSPNKNPSQMSSNRFTLGDGFIQGTSLNVQSIKNHTENNYLYLLSEENFSKFESQLFDLLGFQNSNYKINHQSTEFDSSALNADENFTTKLVTDVKTLENQIESNALDELQFKKVKKVQKLANVKETSNIGGGRKSPPKGGLQFKIVTVILNQQSIRPRKGGRFLLTKKNTSSLDAFLNEVNDFFRDESLVVRKLFTLRGNQIYDIGDIFYNNQDNIFIAFVNDKIHGKDFELDVEETALYYANQFMKDYTYITPEELRKKNLSNRKASTHSLKKSKKLEILSKNQNGEVSITEEILENYEIGPIIGEGTYALVRECKDINTGIKFALKIIDLKKCAGKEDMIENELTLLRKVKHPNIIKLVEEYRSNNYVYLILEYYRGGSLFDIISKRFKFTEKEASSIMHYLVSAVAHLHACNIVHRDIKLENILIQQYPNDNISLKLADFGLATVVNGPLNQKCGSPIYVAPEILFDKTYGFEVDVWSLGVIAYVLLCGYAPFQGETDEETFNLIKSQNLIFPSQDWAHISADAVDLIRKMLDRNQTTRIKIADVLMHKWISKDSKAPTNDPIASTSSEEKLDDSSNLINGKNDSIVSSMKTFNTNLQLKKNLNYTKPTNMAKKNILNTSTEKRTTKK